MPCSWSQKPFLTRDEHARSDEPNLELQLTPDVSHELIQVAAYFRWLNRGGRISLAADKDADFILAEQDLKGAA